MNIWKIRLMTAIVVLILGALLITGCGDDDDPSTSSGQDDNDDQADDDVNDDADDDVDDDSDDDGCPDSEVWDDARGECVDAQCGAHNWPDSPDAGKTLIYVDPSNTSEADGSMEKPYPAIGDALAAAGEDTSILIAAGEYDENLMIGLGQDGVDLIGRCASLCKVESEADDNLLNVRQTQDNLISGLHFKGDQIPDDTDNPMIEIESVTDFSFENNVVENSPFGGLIIRDSSFALTENTFEGNDTAALYVSGADGGVIDGNTFNNNPGRGMNITQSTQMEIINNEMTGNEDAAIYFGESDGEISVNEISDVQGRGISVEECEDFDVSDNRISGCEDHGIYVFDSAGLVFQNLVDNNERGLEVLSCENMTISENILDGNVEVGIFFNEGADSEISENTIYNTQPNADGEFGYALLVQDSTNMTVNDNETDENSEGGIVFISSSGAIEGNLVLDTAERQAKADGYTYGHGIHVQDSEDVICDGNDVGGSVHHGIFFLNTTGGEIINNYVSDTSSGSDDELGGDGLTTVFAENISVSDNVAEENERCGSVSDASTGMIQRNEIIGNGYAVVTQNGSDMIVGDNDISGNGDNSVQGFDNRQMDLNDGGVPEL